MARTKVKLGRPDVAAVIDEAYVREKVGWRKTRLLAVKLAARGEHSSEEIAELCGIGRSNLFNWLGAVRAGGLEALLRRGKPGPRPEAPPRGVPAEVFRHLAGKLEAGEFTSGRQVQRWLEREHGLPRPYTTVWNWLKKAGGVLVVPRPRHSRKDPAAAEAFKGDLAARLEALGLAPGTRARIWMMDEARFGLHTELRRVWTLKGRKPVVARQTRYEWDYLYGSLDVVGGGAHFLHLPSVGLEFDRLYLESLAATDPLAVHILIRDQAGFHLRDGDPRLPQRVRIVDLPPYSPELNPCEQLWDVVKDETANRVFATVAMLRDALLPPLRRFWEDSRAVLSLVGRDWLALQVNGSNKIHQSN